MNNEKAVIFDFGGVLLDWNPYYLFRKIMVNDTEIESFLQEIGFKAWNYECDKGLPFTTSLEELRVKFPHRAELLHAYNERWLETLGCVFEANVALLRSLKEQGVPLYGLSNWSEEKFSLTRPKYEFFEWFDDMVISGIEKVAKPDPRLYRTLLERNQLDPSKCVYIDDSEDNIRTGRSLGFNCILYGSSQQLRRELRKMGFEIQ